MHDLPHRYAVAASATSESNVETSSEGLASIDAAPPAEFGGPGDLWSPETLLCAAVADCFVLTFRAIARASKFEWVSLRCDVDGVLDKPERAMLFTEFRLRVVLDAPAGVDENKSMRLLTMAEKSCLITNSLTAETHLDAEVRTAA